MKLVVVSHSPVAKYGDGWLTKNRVGAIADRLATLGWEVTLVALEGPPADFLTHRLSDRVRVEPYCAKPFSFVRAAIGLRNCDAGLVFMPTLRTAVLGILLGSRGVGYWGNAWGTMAGVGRARVLLESLVARRLCHLVVHGERIRERFTQVTFKVTLCVPLVPAEVAERLRSGGAIRVDGSPIRALFVGTIIPRKGVPELLDALHQLNELHEPPRIECRIIGPVADDALATRIRDELPSLPNVGISNYVEWPELRAAYEWANVFILPSHAEGFPRVAYEAAAFGAALIVTPVGAIPDRLLDGRDAVFVPVGDSAAIAHALRELNEDASRVVELAAAATRALRGFFTHADPADQFDRKLREIAAGKRFATHASQLLDSTPKDGLA